MARVHPRDAVANNMEVHHKVVDRVVARQRIAAAEAAQPHIRRVGDSSK